MPAIPMVDLHTQYLSLKDEIDDALHRCMNDANFIGGKAVQQFEKELSSFIGIKHAIGCANGTDALTLALMALDFPRGSKVLVPAFTYIAPVEAIVSLGLVPVYADVESSSFNVTLEEIKKVFTDDIRAVIIVPLFGQPCESDEIYQFTLEKNIPLIEDNAQSLAAEKNITRSSIITTSFFPSKNLGAYGDGGAVLTNDDQYAEKIRKLANHGQSARYFHDLAGMNSRLDAIQAAVLNVKLKYLDTFISKRRAAAEFYNNSLMGVDFIQTPQLTADHTFHQYTLKVQQRKRDALETVLRENEIAYALYYPLPCYRQKAYYNAGISLPNTETLCSSVLSLPVFPEITRSQQKQVCDAIKILSGKKFKEARV